MWTVKTQDYNCRFGWTNSDTQPMLGVNIADIWVGGQPYYENRDYRFWFGWFFVCLKARIKEPRKVAKPGFTWVKWFS